MMFLNKTVQNINRIGEVINILIKYSFEDIVSSTALRRFVSTKKHVSKQYEEKAFFEYTRWERIRMVIEDLGPTFVKLAQFISTRPDILPEPLIKEFEKLQSHVPPFSSKTAKEIIESETGKKINELFNYFDNFTIGSASIGQVHRARLRSGEDVVIKVQRPDAVIKVKTDLILLYEFIKLTENYFINLGILNPLEIVQTFEESMQYELDYLIEAKSIQQFRNIHLKYPSVYIPKPYREFSTSKVLIQEFISGCELTDVEQIKSWGLDINQIIKKILQIYINQIFKFGLFHADPHPGNILVYPSGKIALIDFGLIGRLTIRQRYSFAGILVGIATQNAKLMATSLRKLTIKSEIEDMQIFEDEMQALIDDFKIFDSDSLCLNELATRMQKIIYLYRLRLPGSVLLVLKSLAILEGVIHKISPEFKILEYIKPYGKKIVREQFSMNNLKSEILFSLSQLMSMLNSAPLDLKYILRQIRTGKVITNIQIAESEKMMRSLESSANRVVFGMIISSLLIGSSIITISITETSRTILGMPVASIIGYSTAVIIAIWMLFNVLRHRLKK